MTDRDSGSSRGVWGVRRDRGAEFRCRRRRRRRGLIGRVPCGPLPRWVDLTDLSAWHRMLLNTEKGHWMARRHIAIIFITRIIITMTMSL